MLLMRQYEKKLANGQMEDNLLQRSVITAMQSILDSLGGGGLWQSWFRKHTKNRSKGLYLYGPIGVGKTFLLDLFYANVADRHKQRVHFHQFMQQIDGQLRKLQGHPDPLKTIAQNLSKKTHVLCLDEFMVLDIATAMVLTELFHYLYQYGIILILTSNTAPDDLYLNGLQRVRFIPTIALIKQHCEVINLSASRDYRLGHALSLQAFFSPLNAKNHGLMSRQFDNLAGTILEDSPLCVQGREIPYVKRTMRAIWFNFDVICNLPRSQLDYLEIATRFAIVFIDNIPQLSEANTIGALLLTHFVDVMYDKRVKLVLSASVSIDALYPKGEVYAAFQRTKSRLHEMQSADYLRSINENDS